MTGLSMCITTMSTLYTLYELISIYKKKKSI